MSTTEEPIEGLTMRVLLELANALIDVSRAYRTDPAKFNAVLDTLQIEIPGLDLKDYLARQELQVFIDLEEEIGWNKSTSIPQSWIWTAGGRPLANA
jgi:hypothetical protein